MLGELLTAIVTPFGADGSVDLGRFRALARYLVANGSDGLVVTGTTGESPTLTDDERFALYAAAVEEVGDRATVIAGTGTYSTAHSVHLTEKAHELGVDGFLVVTPYYSKPPPRGIVRHFEAIAAVTDRPVVVYNIPSRVVVNTRAGDDRASWARSRTSSPSSRLTPISSRRAASSRRGSRSTRATTTSSSRSSSSGAPAASACTRTWSGRR